jgi:hypothetical protein
MALWIQSLSSTEAQQECGQAEELLFSRQECQQAEDFCQEPSGRRLANFVRPQASLLRTTKDKPAYCCTLIIDGKIIFLRTPKCYLRRSWAHNPEDSKNNPLLRAQECQADRETSLVVGRGHISWLTVGLLALTRQKQLTKLRWATNQPVSQCYVYLFQDCLSCRKAVPPRRSQNFLQQARNGTARNNLQK